MRPDVPPSFDRNRFTRRKIVFGSLFAIAITGIAVYTSLTFFSPQDNFGIVHIKRSVPQKSTRAKAELASAFQAVQSAVMARLGPQNLKGVEWLEPRHEGHMGWYSYEGQVKIMGWQGEERISEYALELELNPDDSWKILTITVEWR